MHYRNHWHKRYRNKLMSCAGVCAITAKAMMPISAMASDHRTPIKHVIVIIGENRSFDPVFATYQPVHDDENVLNLLSKKVINADGTPGPNYSTVTQSQATGTGTFQLSPPSMLHTTLPPALTGGPSVPYVCQALGVTTGTSWVTPANITAAQAVENGLASDYYTRSPEEPRGSVWQRN